MQGIPAKLMTWIEPKNGKRPREELFPNDALKALIIPIIIEQFLATLVGMADTMMITYAGEEAVSGVSLVNQLNWVFIMIFSAMANGGTVIIAQYIGSRDREKSSFAMAQMMRIVIFASLACTVVVLIFGEALFHMLFGMVDPGVARAGLTYMRILAFSYLFIGLHYSCVGLFRSLGDTRTVMYVSVLMNVINVCGNAIGIFVLKAGVAGVAVPSLISYVVAAAVMLALTARREDVRLQIRDMLAHDREMVRRIIRIAAPNALEGGLFQVSKVALSSLLSTFGTAHIAAYGVAASFWSMAGLFVNAIGPAFITVIGQYMGAGDVDGADYSMSKLLRISFLGSFLWSVAFTAFAPALLTIYSLTEETAGLVMIMIVLHNIAAFLFCPAAFPLSNGLRAAGDIRYTTASAIFATVVCRVAFSLFFGVVLHMGAIGITLGMICDWAIKAALIYVRRKSGKWKNFRII